VGRGGLRGGLSGVAAEIVLISVLGTLMCCVTRVADGWVGEGEGIGGCNTKSKFCANYNNSRGKFGKGDLRKEGQGIILL